MRVDQAKRLKELEKENARLKKLVADLSLDCMSSNDLDTPLSDDFALSCYF